VPSSQYTAELANTTLVSGKTLAIIKFTAPPAINDKDLVAIDTAGSEQKWSQVSGDQQLDFTQSGSLAEITQTVTMGAQEQTKSSGNFEKLVGWAHVAGTLQTQEVYEITDGTTTVTLKTAAGGNQIGSPVLITDASTFWNVSIKRRHTAGGILSGGTHTLSVSGKQANYKVALSANLSPTSTAERPLVDAVLFDCDGYKDDGSGTYTGSASALIEKPADVLHHLARVVGGLPSARVDGSAFSTLRSDMASGALASYKFAGNLIDRASNLKELLLALSFQARVKIDWPVDRLTARLLRSSYSSPPKTIGAANIAPETLQVTRGDAKDLINKIDLRYGRAWHEGRSEHAYTKISKASDSTSIAKYGALQEPGRFWCDFIRDENSTMADDVRDFWLSWLKEPARRVSLDAMLDQYEALAGDLRALDYLFGASEKFDGMDGSQKFLVESVVHVPGAPRQGELRRMRLALREVA
jgi:hypothetical protein